MKVSEFVPEQRMVWIDGRAPMFKGVRTYTLTPQADGSTGFSMTEVFSGIMLPMIAGSLPDFGSVFEQYAADLKRAAEQTSQSDLLIVEDVHWCDENSLELLLYLVRYCTRQRLLFLFTYRSEETSTFLSHWLAQLDREHLALEFDARSTRRSPTVRA